MKRHKSSAGANGFLQSQSVASQLALCEIFLPNPSELFHFAVVNLVATTTEEEMVSQEEVIRRARQGKLVAFLAISWWVASIGGIIWVITANA